MARHLKAGAARARAPRLWPWVLACLVWMAYIWGHSLVPGPRSLDESGFFSNLLAGLFQAIGIGDAGERMFIIRKGAHFTEYAIFGALLAKARSVERATAGSGTRRHAMTAAFICWGALVPVVDETIQRFVPGRSGQLGDVALDLCGACVGALICAAIMRARRRPRAQRA